MTAMEAFDCDGLSDLGHIRGVNGDQFLIAELHKSIFIHKTSIDFENHTSLLSGAQSHLLMVADGGGGWTAERQASDIAVRTLTQYILNMMPWLYRLDTHHENDFLEDLTSALKRSQNRIEDVSEASDAPRDMGASLTMASISWPRLYVVHVGNCRCYLLRQGTLEQITTDHTLAQQLLESGVLQQKEMSTSKLSQVLWNAIGGDMKELNPEVYKAQLQPGDVLLLCTDGLSKHVTHDAIRECLQVQEPAATTCHKLVHMAKADGGTDNITAVVARFHREAQSVDDALAEMAEPTPSETTFSPAVPVSDRLATEATEGIVPVATAPEPR
jgi:protein phosphatase